MKISNTILAVFQLTNEMSAKAAHQFLPIYIIFFYVCAQFSSNWLESLLNNFEFFSNNEKDNQKILHKL